MLSAQRIKEDKKNIIKAILLAFEQTDLKKLNDIFNKLSREDCVDILSTKINSEMKVSTFFGTSLVKLLHPLTYENVICGLKNLPNRIEQLNVTQFLQDLFKKLDRRLVTLFRPGETWHTQFLYPYLSECACSGYFNRNKYSRRETIEQDIIGETRRSFPVKTTTELNYLSFGSGLLLPDFILLFKLILLGYSLNVVLVELNSHTEEFINAMRQLHLLAYAAAEKNLTFYIRSFKSIQDYIHQFPDETVHIAHAIDLVSLPVDDLFAVYTCLVEKGFLYIADRFHDFIMTRDEVIFSSRYQANLSPRYTREMDEKTYAQAEEDYQNLKIRQALAPCFENKKMIINEVLSYLGLFSAKKGPPLSCSLPPPTARAGERVLGL